MRSTPFTVWLLTEDEQTITIDRDIFKQFGIFHPQNGPEQRPREPVPVPNVKAAVSNKAFGAFQHISCMANCCLMLQAVEYYEYHREDEPQLETTSVKLTEWNKIFIATVSQEELFNIILAGNQLGLKPLY
ncbi:hypothetical protein OPQ81_008032 [Rhizoctonia solani]|nr:hypothetical protein OPQ81_008032 [Rhizoctonia solani]